MTQRMILPLLFGLLGCAVLIWLGIWQVQRLSWKQEILADINTQVTASPVELPQNLDPERDRYLPVTVSGDLTGEEIHVLASVKRRGAGYRVISVLQMGQRRILIDRGFISTERKDEVRAADGVTITGNLHWPNEVDSYTPEPDSTREIWFARDLPAMAEALETEPVLVVARSSSATDPVVDPLPINTSAIPNDHLQYAITWFSLAVLWFGMTLYLLWRIRQRTI